MAERRTVVGAEKSGTLTDHVVEDEESVDLGQEADFVGTERHDLVIRADEALESRLGERVRGIGELGPVAGSARNPREEVEIEQARFDAKPVVVPAREQSKVVAVSRHREVPQVPIDEYRDLGPVVVVHLVEADQEVVGMAAQHTDVFRWQLKVA